MTTETRAELGTEAESTWSDPAAPARPDASPWRLIRRLAGVDEELLAWVPEERPRSTRLGAIIANTGLLAALSMFFALSTIVAMPWPYLVPTALLWGFIIINLDGWLVASTHGILGSARLRVFL